MIPIKRDRDDFPRRVTSSFENVLCQIEAENREPTGWEGMCLLAALTAMATGECLTAKSLIDSSRRSVPAYNLPRTEITLEGLRAGLAQARDCGNVAQMRSEEETAGSTGLN
jgi:hypothetical protein